MPFPAQLPAIHTCQSSKGCVLQGVVGSTVLVTAAATSSLLQAGGTARNSGLYWWVAPRWVSPGALQPPKLWPCSLKNWELEEEQSAGGISIPYLPPGKHPGAERQGKQSWHLRGNRDSTGAAKTLLLEEHVPNLPCFGGWSLQRNIRMCWRMPAVVGWLRGALQVGH